MLTDDEITGLQLAVEAADLAQVQEIISEQGPEALNGLQLFADHTLLMYACERSTPEVVEYLLKKGARTSELEWSTNNELKSALRNADHRREILALILPSLPEEIRADMIETDWDPDDIDEGKAQSPLQMAQELKDQACLELLSQYLS